MKQLKKLLRLFALILFILLAGAGIGLFGVAPTLAKDGKLFADTEAIAEFEENSATQTNLNEKLKR